MQKKTQSDFPHFRMIEVKSVSHNGVFTHSFLLKIQAQIPNIVNAFAIIFY